jgi:hypothetical protein
MGLSNFQILRENYLTDKKEHNMGGPGSGRKKGGGKTRFNTGTNSKKNKDAFRKKNKSNAKIALKKYKALSE